MFTPPLPRRGGGMMAKGPTSPPLRMFFLVVSISFIVELGERLLPLGSVDQISVEGVVDAALLSLTLAPVLYLLTYQPWQKQVARRLSAQRDPGSAPELLLDARTADDAAVYRISDELAVVQSVDLITPIVDDPYAFGQIVAANALSDLYAKGASPVLAL